MLLRASVCSSLTQAVRANSRVLFSSAAAVKVPTDLLKQLRERTGSPMMECKNALADANLDLEKAVDLLRKKGAVHASKAAGRTASCGLVATGVSVDARTATVVELNCETDFVERNERFQTGLQSISAAILASASTLSAQAAKDSNGAASLNMEGVKQAKTSTGSPIADEVNMLVSAIRENIILRRAASISVEHGVVGSYVHNSVRPGLGRVAALVSLKTPAAVSSNSEQLKALQALADRLAMHAAGMKPQYLSRASVPADAVQREEAIHFDAVKSLKKPEAVVKNIVAGKMSKFYGELCLSEQAFALPESPAEEVSVGKLIAAEAKKLKLGAEDVQLGGFVVYEVGKGVQVAAAEQPAKAL